MSIAILLLELRIPYSHSLKEKRSSVMSLLSKIKKDFNIAATELAESQDLWQKANVGVVSINNSSSELNSTLNRIVDYVQNFSSVELINYKIENL